jgi:uncharacterized membrane protein YphA (DoxX/SURF4 family)
LIAVIMLVLLRVSIGWHFLYAGIWKLQHPEFSSEGFLSQAKGPLAGEFHKLIPDSEGLERLEIILDEPIDAPVKPAGQKAVGKKAAAEKAEAEKRVAEKAPAAKVAGAAGHETQESMKRYYQAFVATYKVAGDQLALAEHFSNLRLKQMDEFYKDHQEDFNTYKLDLQALHAAQKKPDREVPYQQERNWKKQTELRKKSQGWLAERERIWEGLETDLNSLLSRDQRERGNKEGAPVSPIDAPNHIDQIVTYTNVVIGVCLMVGLFTRFANIAGALFLLQIVLAQPDWPGLYPPPPPSAGRTLIVGKEFIEMMAMFALAATPVGRWGGLDFFVHNLLIRPIFGKRD